MVRTRQGIQFYLTILTVLGWLFVVQFPRTLSQAASELAADRTTSMDAALLLVCVLWLFAVIEDVNVSLTSGRLLRFPIDVGTLLRIRVLSAFCSPIVLLVAAGSAFGVWPLFSARQPLLAGLGALLLFVFTFSIGLTLSLVLGMGELRRVLGLPVIVVSCGAGALLFANGAPSLEQVRAAMAFSPPHLVAAVAVAGTASAALVPLGTLLSMTAIAAYLLVWTFRRSLYSQKRARTGTGASVSFLRLPGRFSLVGKEQAYFRKVLDIWPGLLLTLALTAASVLTPPAPLVRQMVIVVVLALNVSLFMNFLGLDTPSEFNRYLIFPLRGRDVLLVKNIGLMVIAAAQLSLVLLMALWQSGPLEAGLEMLEATIVLLSHLALGNLASVMAPSRVQFYRFVHNRELITALATMAIGSIPGVLVVALIQSEYPWAAWGIALILMLTIVVYLGALHYAGASFERRRHVISERLA